MTVYLLHFSQKVRGNCQHYIGQTQDLEKRLSTHRRGNGAKIVAQLLREGGDFYVAQVWTGVDKWFELRLKAQKHAAKFCPICQGV